MFLIGVVLLAAPLRAETPKQRFAFTVDGDWPVQEAQGNSAWIYDMSGFFHIELDTTFEKDAKQRVILDIVKMGDARPKVGKYKISRSNLTHYSATLELQGDYARTVRSGSGELHIKKTTPLFTTGSFTFKSNPASGGPDIKVSGDFVAKERPKRKKKE